MDLPITATWCNYSGSGTHPSSIREAKRIRGIHFIKRERGDHGCISIANTCRFVNCIKGY